MTNDQGQDPISQYPGYIEYAKSNPYHPLVDDSVISSAEDAWTKAGGCRDQVWFFPPQSVLHVFTYAQIIACNNGGSNSVCSGAQGFCNNNILSPLAGNWDVYYVPTANPDPYPPPLDKYLNSQAVTSKIGSHAEWEESNSDVYKNFAATGDWMRTSLPDLEKVINAGVRTVIYDGDADFILNFKGVEAMVRVHSPHIFAASRLLAP